MSRVESQTIIEAEQALAILRDAPAPMTATEVGKGIGYASISPCRGEHGPSCIGVFTCRGNGTDLLVRTGILGGHAMRSLDLLLRRGQVSRERVGHRVYWSYVQQSEQAQVVEELFALDRTGA